MKILKKKKRIILAGVVALTISTVIATNVSGGFTVGKATQTDVCSIDPPGH
ncbi:hypothetical protein [Clostridium sp. FP1]|uniref:hypothetical protein n=1 Tax=Clostridium sp. FP1 TaxID=2724076 RepID=UPI0013E90A2B|nr:hypothetical protein [Clostridium sp. FP1]MBZ9635527.1 hypothetical protein [Clostridium sp. FP1]